MRKKTLPSRLVILVLLLIFSINANSQNIDSIPKIYQLEEVDNKPEFKGGKEKLFKFVMNNLRYPGDALRENMDGRVLVDFVVTRSGYIINAKVRGSLYPSLDAEALRIITKMSQQWVPGEKDGQAVDVAYFLPILFRTAHSRELRSSDENHLINTEITED